MRGPLVIIAGLVLCLGCDKESATVKNPKYVKATLEFPETKRSKAFKVEITDANEVQKWKDWFVPPPQSKFDGMSIAWKPMWWIEFESAGGDRFRVGFDDRLWMIAGQREDYATKPGFNEFFIAYNRDLLANRPTYSKAVVSGVWPRDYRFTLTGADAQALADKFPGMHEQDKSDEVEPRCPKTNGTVVFAGPNGEITVGFNQGQWCRDGNFPRDWIDGDWAYIEKLIAKHSKTAVQYVKAKAKMPVAGQSVVEWIRLTDRDEIDTFAAWFDSPDAGSDIDLLPLHWVEFEEADGAKRKIGFDDRLWRTVGERGMHLHKDGFWSWYKAFQKKVLAEHNATTTTDSRD